jgi:hypothetical protein
MSAMQEPLADARRAAYLHDAEQIVRDRSAGRSSCA